MSRLATPVANRATATPRTRAARPRATQRHPRLDLHIEILRPADLELGPLFTHTRDGAVVVNTETGRIALWNPAAERTFGWSAAEAIGQPIEIVISPSVLALHQAARAAHGTTLAGRPFEVPASTRRGDDIRVELTFVAIDRPQAPGRYVLALLRDVSDRRRTERHNAEAAQLEAAREEAEQRVRRHQQFVHDGLRALQHDVRRLHATANRLQRQTREHAEGRLGKRAHVIQARAERVKREIEALATRAAIESGALEVRGERVNLVPLINRAVSRLRERGLPHKINVAVPQGLTATADVTRLEQLVEALLDHAVARCPRGCWIDVDLRRPLVGLARLEVRDFGRPLSDEHRRELEAGGHSDRRLALARAIVELHGGTLSFEFPADGGLRAVATLPTHPGRVPLNAPAVA